MARDHGAAGRTGADALVAGFSAAGARYVFGNPGSTELAFLDALGRQTALEYVTCLHEAVAVGAAEGYARVSRRPGVVQLHTSAGLGNAVGMLGNARVGGTPLVAYVGCPARTAAHTEPVLGGDPVAIASPVAKWAWEVRTAAELPAVVARAFKVAATPPLGPVVLVVPLDVMAEPCAAPPRAPSYVRTRSRPDETALSEAVAALASAASPALVVGDGVAVSGAGEEAAVVAELLSAPIYSALTESVLPAQHGLDAGALPVFDGAAVAALLAPHDAVLAVGTPFLRLFSPAPDSLLRPEVVLVQIGADPWELGKNQPCLAIEADERSALRELVAALKREGRAATRPARSRMLPAPADGWTPDAALAALASVLPADVLLVDESVSAMEAVARRLPLRPGSWFRSRGGALGAGMAMPVGAALAAPDRPVVAIVGDGAAMYTAAALWTLANRGLRATVVVLDNGGYKILEASARKLGLGTVGTDLRRPPIDFAALARSVGVSAHRLEVASEAPATFRRALARTPSLVHVVLDPTEGGT